MLNILSYIGCGLTCILLSIGIGSFTSYMEWSWWSTFPLTLIIIIYVSFLILKI